MTLTSSPPAASTMAVKTPGLPTTLSMSFHSRYCKKPSGVTSMVVSSSPHRGKSCLSRPIVASGPNDVEKIHKFMCMFSGFEISVIGFIEVPEISETYKFGYFVPGVSGAVQPTSRVPS